MVVVDSCKYLYVYINERLYIWLLLLVICWLFITILLCLFIKTCINVFVCFREFLPIYSLIYLLLAFFLCSLIYSSPSSLLFFLPSFQYKANLPYIACDTYEILLSKDPVLMAAASTDSNIITYNKVLYDQHPSGYPSITNNTRYGEMNYLQCYCGEILNQNKLLNIVGYQSYEFYNIINNSIENYCDTPVSNGIAASAFVYVATFVIIIVNQILMISLRRFVLFERLSSQSTQILSLTFKLFIATYINTGLLIVIINGNLNNIGVLNYNFITSQYFTFGFFTGTLFDYNQQW